MTCSVRYMLFMVFFSAFNIYSVEAEPVRVTKHHVQVVGNFHKLPIYNTSLDQCAQKCIERSRCSGINYCKRYLLCEVLFIQNVSDSVDKSNGTFLHVKRTDILGQKTDTNLCPDCENCVYNTTSQECEHKECPDYIVPGSDVYGNRKTVGAKILVKCFNNLTMVNGIARSHCQANGTWSSSPNCYWDCGEPRTYMNAAIRPGGTLNGTIRTYDCVNDFFISGYRQSKQKSIVCNYGGGWTNGPRCVKDCYQPPPAHNRSAESLTDGDVKDHAQRVYTCPLGFVVLTFEEIIRYDIVVRNRKMPDRYRIVTCNGQHPAWRNSNFICVPDCKDPPVLRNIKNVTHTYKHNVTTTTTAIYICSNGHVVYKDPILTNKKSFTSVCDSPNGTWTHSNWACVKQCRQRPIAINADVSATVQYSSLVGDMIKYDKSNTTLLYTCSVGHVVFRDNAFSLENSFESLCSIRNGTWTNADFVCAKDCRNPPDESNVGNITYSHTSSSTEMTYECVADYVVLKGDQFTSENTFTSECRTPNGSWTNSDYSCIRACNNEPQPENAELVSYTNGDDVSVLEYTCTNGYIVYRNNTITYETEFVSECMVTNETSTDLYINSTSVIGNWTNSDITCVKCMPSCSNLPDPWHVESITYTYTSDATTINYICKPGHVIYQQGDFTSFTESASQCTDPNGKWTNSDLACVIECRNPPSDIIGSVKKTAYLAQTIAEYTCRNGYVLYQDDELTQSTTTVAECNSPGGSWEFTPFDCVPDCGPVLSLLNATVANVEASHDKVKVTYSCNITPTERSATVLCTVPDGAWKIVENNCPPITDASTSSHGRRK